MKLPKGPWPKIIIFKEKHADRHYIADCEIDYIRIFAYVGYERAKEGYWYEDKQNKSVIDYQAAGKITPIAEFVLSRITHEYEGVEIEIPDVVGYI